MSTFQETLRQHFSRRASAARIAFRKLRRRSRPVPLTDKPSSGASQHFDELPHR